MLPVVMRWAIPVVLMLAVLGSLCEAAADGDLSGRFFDESKQGWFWYEDPAEPEGVWLPPTPLVPVPPKVHDSRQLKEALKQLPLETVNTDELPSEWLKALLSAKREAALDRPTEHTVKDYIIVHRASFARAQKFTDVWNWVMYTNPELDFASQNPTSTLGHQVYAELKEQEQEQLLRQASESVGLYFFFTSTCPYCQEQSRLLKVFTDTYGFKVFPVTKDGRGLPNYPDAKADNGMGEQLGVKMVPMVFLAIPQENFVVPLGAGVITLDELRQRIVAILEKRNWIRPIQSMEKKS